MHLSLWGPLLGMGEPSRHCVAAAGFLRCLDRKFQAVQISAGEPSTVNMSLVPQEFAAVNRVIHEPARFIIMMLLHAVPEADFLYIQKECGYTQGNLSSHLRKLDETGY